MINRLKKVLNGYSEISYKNISLWLKITVRANNSQRYSYKNPRVIFKWKNLQDLSKSFGIINKQISRNRLSNIKIVGNVYEITRYM